MKPFFPRDASPKPPAVPVWAGLHPFAGFPLLKSGGVVKLFPGLKPIRRVVRDHGALDPVLGRLGSLEVRLATTAKEIRRAQRLRFKVFYEEMAAVPNGAALLSRRDVDAYDFICDHILVLDHAVEPKPFRKPKPKVVGTYRLLRHEVADRHDGFYTASEYDIAPLIDANPHLRFLELGRSCVLEPYRYVSMNRMSREAVDPKAALHALPPLIKGYLRVGATFGDGAVIDRQFGTTDVFVVLPVSAISQRYIAHFGPTANRHAA